MAHLQVDLVGGCSSGDHCPVVLGLRDVEMDDLLADVPCRNPEVRLDVDRKNDSELSPIVELLVAASLVQFGQQLRPHNAPFNREDLFNEFDLIIFLHHRELDHLIFLNLLPQHKHIPLRRANQVLILPLQRHQIPHIIRVQMIRNLRNVNHLAPLLLIQSNVPETDVTAV